MKAGNLASIPSDRRFETQGGSGGDLFKQQRRGLNPLDSFFPFDPCLLSQVHEFVQDGYISWEGIRGLDYRPDSSTTNYFVDERAFDYDEDDNEEENEKSLVSSVSSSITSLSLTQSGVSFEPGGLGMSVGNGASFNAASSLVSSTYGSSSNQGGVYDYLQSNGDMSTSPYNIRILEKRSRQYSVGSTGSW
jgi:hypothetical protein